MLQKDDFLDIFHANTSVVYDQEGKQLIALQSKEFEQVIKKLLERYVDYLKNSINFS